MSKLILMTNGTTLVKVPLYQVATMVKKGYYEKGKKPKSKPAEKSIKTKTNQAA